MTSQPVSLDLVQGPEPAYVRVREHLADQIARGYLQEGARLMPERLLASELGVSRVTVRRSLQQLVDEGILTPSHGRGWFVTAAPAAPPDALRSMTEQAAARGVELGTRHVASSVEAATPEQAKRLGVRGGTRLVRVERVRLEGSRPVAHVTSWLPQKRFRSLPEADLRAGSLWAWLAEQGVRPEVVEVTVSAAASTGELSTVLKLKSGSPLLRVEQVTRDADGTAYELAVAHHVADRYVFASTVARHGR